MNAPAAELLRALGSSVRTPGLGRMSPGLALDDSDFDTMLGLARGGKLSSGRACAIDGSLGLDLTQDQLARLSAAADTAQTSGAGRALILLDGQALELDVANRRVTGRLLGPARAEGFDAVIAAAPSSDAPVASKPALGRDLLRGLGGTLGRHVS